MKSFKAVVSIIILFVFLFNSKIHSNAAEFVDIKLIEQKISSKKTRWMDERITKDFQPFHQKRITSKNIRRNYFNILKKFEQSGKEPGVYGQLVLYKIKDNAISYISLSDTPRIGVFCSIIRMMAEFLKLPNIEFLVSHHDLFEYPSINFKVPLFVAAKLKNSPKQVLFPPLAMFYKLDDETIKSLNKYSWGEKKDIAFWRGNISCGRPQRDTTYNYIPLEVRSRSCLVKLSQLYPDFIDAKHVANAQEHISPSDQVAYKFLISKDGNSYPTSLRWQLFTNSVVLHNETDCIIWISDIIQPYVHYVPFSWDTTDLIEKIQWLRKNDEVSQQIIRNAQLLANDCLTLEDIVVYYYKLFNAYSQFFTEN